MTDSASLTEVERSDSYRFSSSRIRAAKSSVESGFDTFFGSKLEVGS